MPQTAFHRDTRAASASQFVLGTAAGLAAVWATKQLVRKATPDQMVTGKTPVARAEMTTGTLPKASILETLAVMLDVLLPNMAKGLILRRPKVLALAESLDLERRAVRRMQSLRDKYWPGPLLLRLPIRSQALVLNDAHLRRVLQGTPEPFASASTEKQAALGHFQPKGVLVSHNPERAARRRINDEVLDAHKEVHRMADGFLSVVNEEATRLLTEIRQRGELTWDDFVPAWFRIVRRVVLGDAAADDNRLTDMLAQLRADANWAFLKPRREQLQARFFQRLQEYVVQAEPGSLATLVSAMNHGGDEATHQVPQWLFAFDAAGIATYRALALLAAHPEYLVRVRQEIATHPADARHELPLLRAAVLESVRLWPATPVILRQSTAQTEWETGTMPANTGLLIYAPFFHRDETRLPFANRFAPEIWLEQDPSGKWPLVPFSGGPGFCSGRNLVLLLSSAMLAALLEGTPLRLHSLRRLNPYQPLPTVLNSYSLRFNLEEPAAMPVEMPPASPG